ncbi:MAG TPA: ABC transporter ATP-binding protein [Steroidobacteraceae bacterium]|nr:ABC transporter ATP-binding protein [Steroidobacteraceae bacterium]
MIASVAAPLLRFDGVRIETSGRAGSEARTLLEGLSFDVAAGEFVAVVGESGSGKTLAARSILSLLPAGVRQTAGRIELQGRDLSQLSAPEMRQVRGAQIGMVFQEPMVSLNPAMTLERQLAEGMQLHRNLPSDEIRRQSIAMLERVRISNPLRCLKSYPHEFSGGMRQRIMLASVLLLKPKLLIADEPTTALDTLSQREVLELMVELAHDNGAAVLLITHDLGLVARYTERAIVLEKGRLMESGFTDEILANPQNPYTQRLVASLPRGRADLVPPPDSAPTLLQVRQACIEYPGRPGIWRAGVPTQVVHGVSLDVRAGEIVAVVGASGSGKSTLGRAVLGLKPLAAGTISFDGIELAAMTAAQRKQFRRDAQLVFQDPYSSLDPRRRVRDIVGATLRHVDDLDAAERRARVQSILEEVGLSSFGDRFPHQMSGGQRQRVAIARAVVSRPRLVVADEPVSALDVTIQQQVLTLLQTLQAQYGFACLFITHDLAVVRQIATRVVVMSGGIVVEEGPVASVFAAPAHKYTRELLEATPSLEVVSLPRC